MARRSTCFRRSIGAHHRPGRPDHLHGLRRRAAQDQDSVEHGFCLRDQLGIPHGQRYELCRSVHAEQNAIINAARAGVSLLGGDMYIYRERARRPASAINAFPCFICKKMIINAGLVRVVCSTAAGLHAESFASTSGPGPGAKRDILDDTHQYGKKS